MTDSTPIRGDVVRLRGTEDIASARSAVSRAAQPLLGTDRAGDVALVISELVTNALEHGTGDGAFVNFGVEDQSFVVFVSSESTTLPAPNVDVALDTPAGRGLQIVEALTDELTISAVGGDVVVMCRFSTAA